VLLFTGEITSEIGGVVSETTLNLTVILADGKAKTARGITSPANITIKPMVAALKCRLLTLFI